MSTITNFRDIGGVKNRHGEQLVTNTFFRSGELSALSEEQSQQLEEHYKLGKIIDLRSEKEVAERPDVSVPNTSYIHIDILEAVEDNGASMEDFVKIGSIEKSKNYMKNLYKDIALDASAQKGYAQFFEEILSLKNDESILFHCFAGKDRTGIGAALILETLEVPKTAIYTDYLLTNQLRKKENAWLLEQAKKAGLEEHHLQALNVALNVDSSYLDEFYRVINEHYGSMADYLRREIKIIPSMRQELRNRFLLKGEKV